MTNAKCSPAEGECLNLGFDGLILASCPFGLHPARCGSAGARRRTAAQQGREGFPTGSSVGAMIMRAAVSQSTRNAPPKRIVARPRTRWSGPTSRRQMCGAIRPTNPIGPQTETIADHHGRDDEEDKLHPIDLDATRRRQLFAGDDQVQLVAEVEHHGAAGEHEGEHREHAVQADHALQAAHHPADHAEGSGSGR